MSRKNSRFSNGSEISVEDTTVFTSLRVDPKITIYHSIQVDRNGKDGQATGFREEVITGEQMGIVGLSGKCRRRSHLLRQICRFMYFLNLVILVLYWWIRPMKKLETRMWGLVLVDPADEPRSEHYALTQLDTGGKTDQGASEYMIDRSLGFVDTKAISARIGGNGNGKLPVSVALGTATNEPISVPAAKKETTSEPYVLLGPVGMEQSPLSVAPGIFTNEPMCFPVVIEATKFEPYGIVQMSPAGGVQSDTVTPRIPPV